MNKSCLIILLLTGIQIPAYATVSRKILNIGCYVTATASSLYYMIQNRQPWFKYNGNGDGNYLLKDKRDNSRSINASLLMTIPRAPSLQAILRGIIGGIGIAKALKATDNFLEISLESQQEAVEKVILFFETNPLVAHSFSSVLKAKDHEKLSGQLQEWYPGLSTATGLARIYVEYNLAIELLAQTIKNVAYLQQKNTRNQPFQEQCDQYLTLLTDYNERVLKNKEIVTHYINRYEIAPALLAEINDCYTNQKGFLVVQEAINKGASNILWLVNSMVVAAPWFKDYKITGRNQRSPYAGTSYTTCFHRVPIPMDRGLIGVGLGCLASTAAIKLFEQWFVRNKLSAQQVEENMLAIIRELQKDTVCAESFRGKELELISLVTARYQDQSLVVALIQTKKLLEQAKEKIKFVLTKLDQARVVFADQPVKIRRSNCAISAGLQLLETIVTNSELLDRLIHQALDGVAIA